ncbi:MAG: threonine synthase, partial [Ferrovibrio sp.]
QNGGFSVSPNALAETQQLFAAGKADEAATKAMLKTAFEASNGLLVDPHTAVGLVVAAAQRKAGALPVETPLVTLATADAAKFPDAVKAATGRHPALPPRMADLFEREERQTPLKNDYATVRNFIETRRVKA